MRKNTIIQCIPAISIVHMYSQKAKQRLVSLLIGISLNIAPLTNTPSHNFRRLSMESEIRHAKKLWGGNLAVLQKLLW